LRIELLIEEKLVLVTTSRRGQAQRATDYVFVDWGPEFAARHNQSFPEFSNAATFVGLGPLGLQYILEAGGSGYFRMNVVRRHLKSGRLRLVAGAAEFAYPAYAVYSENADAKIVTPALAGLRHVASSDQQSPPLSKARQPGASRPRRASSTPRRSGSG
jgi:hypothetical protein